MNIIRRIQAKHKLRRLIKSAGYCIEKMQDDTISNDEFKQWGLLALTYELEAIRLKHQLGEQ